MLTRVLCLLCAAGAGRTGLASLAAGTPLVLSTPTTPNVKLEHAHAHAYASQTSVSQAASASFPVPPPPPFGSLLFNGFEHAAAAMPPPPPQFDQLGAGVGIKHEQLHPMSLAAVNGRMPMPCTLCRPASPQSQTQAQAAQLANTLLLCSRSRSLSAFAHCCAPRLTITPAN